MKKRWKQKVLAAVVSLSMVGTLMPQNPFGVVWERTAEAAVELPKPVIDLDFSGDVDVSGTTYAEDEISYTLNGSARIVDDPDDPSRKVLRTDSGKGINGDYLSTEYGELKKTTFAKGFSISFDIRPDVQPSDWYYIFSFGNADATKYLDGTIGFIARMGNDSDYMPYYPGSGWVTGNNVGSDWEFFKNGINCNKWYHMTYTYSASKVCIYLDGDLIVQQDTTANKEKIESLLADISKTGRLTLGCGVSADFEHIGAYFGDVKIYDSVLSAEQVYETDYVKAETIEPSIKINFDDGTTEENIYSEKKYSFQLNGTSKQAKITNDPDDNENHVLYTGDGYAITQENQLNNIDFTNGFSISMDIRPEVQASDWDYVFGIGYNNDGWNYIDGTIGFIARFGNTYYPFFPGTGWMTPNIVNSDYAYFKDNNNCDKWYNLTYVYGKKEVKIYVNSKLVCKWSLGSEPGKNDDGTDKPYSPIYALNSQVLPNLYKGTLRLGCGIDVNALKTAAYYDNVKIFNRELNKEQVQEVSANSLKLNSDISEGEDGTYTITTDNTSMVTQNGSNYDLHLDKVFSGATLKCYDQESSITVPYTDLTVTGTGTVTVTETGTVTNIALEKAVPVTFQYGNVSVTKKVVVKAKNECQKLTVDKNTGSITKAGESFDVIITATPSNTNGDMTDEIELSYDKAVCT